MREVIMKVVPFAAEHAAGVARLVNAQIISMPPGWQLSETQVWDILQKESLWEIHYEDEEPPAWTWKNEIVCVVENDRVLAAARFDYRYDEAVLGLASARWLVGDLQHPDALRHLLDYLTAKRTIKETKIHVNGRSDFGLGWGGIPTTEGHVMQALAKKGFIPFQRWRIMTADISFFAADRIILLPIRMQSHQWAINESRLEWHLNLYDGENLIGECQSWGIPPEFVDCPDYDRWMQLEWLGVEEPYRRRGLARRMMREQFRYHTTRGIKHCFLYTEVDNAATQALNASLGFTTQAEVWGWVWQPA
jgi:ribosomal protein S18 acetylase RimI-like enzyme